MSYTPTVWKKGDKITSEKLNKLENGVAGSGGGALMCSLNMSTGLLNKTWKEVADAAEVGPVVMLVGVQTGVKVYSHLTTVAVQDGEYGLVFSNGNQDVALSAESETGYPSVIS